MTELSNAVLERYQIRKTRQQKQAFRQWLCTQLKALGYEPLEECDRGSCNVVAGEADAAKLLLTAHYDTCAVLPFPNFITPRNLFWYGLWQILITIPMFIAAVGVTVLTLVVWEDCPMWLVMIPVFGVIGIYIWWMLDGPANRHTANDNTSGVVTLLEIAQALPEEQRARVCFVFFDNEEKGLLGSRSFIRKHPKAGKDALVLNFDCVSDGDFLQLYPEAALKKEEETLSALKAAFCCRNGKTVEVVQGFGFYPSDNKVFLRGIGVCALKKKPVFGYYMDRIHTGRDTVWQEENVLLLRDCVLQFVNRLDD